MSGVISDCHTSGVGGGGMGLGVESGGGLPAAVSGGQGCSEAPCSSQDTPPKQRLIAPHVLAELLEGSTGAASRAAEVCRLNPPLQVSRGRQWRGGVHLTPGLGGRE